MYRVPRAKSYRVSSHACVQNTAVPPWGQFFAATEVELAEPLSRVY